MCRSGPAWGGVAAGWQVWESLMVSGLLGDDVSSVGAVGWLAWGSCVGFFSGGCVEKSVGDGTWRGGLGGRQEALGFVKQCWVPLA